MEKLLEGGVSNTTVGRLQVQGPGRGKGEAVRQAEQRKGK